MYTQQMRLSFHSLSHFAPKGFSLQIIDNEHFLTLKASEEDFMKLSGEDKIRAVEYMIRAKRH